MSSPITFSGFNNVDFNLILNSIMEQEAAPVRSLETRKSTLQSQSNALSQLATKISSLESAARKLSDSSTLSGRSATNTDDTAVRVDVTSTATVGTYDVIVDELARAQVTPSSTVAADTDTTMVASAGSLTIGGTVVTLSGDATLQDLADAINSTPDIAVAASIVQSASGYQLVLTGTETGSANGFAITDNTTGFAFAANTVEASNAAARVNGIAVTSATNIIEGAVPGASLTLLEKDPSKTVTITVGRDHSATEGLIDSFVAAYNDIVQFADDQAASARTGNQNNIGRDSLLRGLRTTMRDLVNNEYAVGGAFSRLSEIGIEFTRTGELEFDKTVYREKVGDSLGDVEKLFLGAGGVSGVFASVADAVDDYVDAGGLVESARDRLDDQIENINSRLDALEARLLVRRAALQQEFIAADLAMSRLNSQSQQLASLGGF